jgi:hypothetical protein
MGDSPGTAARRALDAETEMLALPAPAAPDGNAAELAALVDQAEAFLRQARAENTRRAYASDWKDFERWCAGRQVPACPAAPSTVALYLTALAATHKVSTLTRRLSAISQAHRTAGVPSPTEEAGVRGLMAGIRRSRGTASIAKRPLLVPELQALLATLPDNLLGCRDRALLLARLLRRLPPLRARFPQRGRCARNRRWPGAHAPAQ